MRVVLVPEIVTNFRYGNLRFRILNERIKVTQLVKRLIRDSKPCLPDFEAHLFIHSKKSQQEAAERTTQDCGLA